MAYTVTVTRAARPLSDDATLSGLSLSGIIIGTFASGTTAYTADVDNSVETTTVTAAATQAAATVTVTDGNGITAGGTRTVTLAEGANTITVRVTAEDGVGTMAYTVTVTRAAPSVIGRRDAERVEPVGGQHRDVRERHDGLHGGRGQRAWRPRR